MSKKIFQIVVIVTLLLCTGCSSKTDIDYIENNYKLYLDREYVEILKNNKVKELNLFNENIKLLVLSKISDANSIVDQLNIIDLLKEKENYDVQNQLIGVDMSIVDEFIDGNVNLAEYLNFLSAYKYAFTDDEYELAHNSLCDYIQKKIDDNSLIKEFEMLYKFSHGVGAYKVDELLFEYYENNLSNIGSDLLRVVKNNYSKNSMYSINDFNKDGINDILITNISIGPDGDIYDSTVYYYDITGNSIEIDSLGLSSNKPKMIRGNIGLYNTIGGGCTTELYNGEDMAACGYFVSITLFEDWKNINLKITYFDNGVNKIELWDANSEKYKEVSEDEFKKYEQYMNKDGDYIRLKTMNSFSTLESTYRSFIFSYYPMV